MILLAYPQNSPFLYHRCTPLSIVALGSFLEERNIEVAYFDERIHPLSRFKDLLKKDVEMLGLSAMTSYQIKAALDLAALARELRPNLPLVWGGVHPTMFYEQTLEHPLVDYVIRNEGEITLFEFVQFLRGRKDKHEVANLCFKDKGKIVVTPERPFLDVNILPNPYMGEGAKLLDEYLKLGHSLPSVAVELSRGCPYHCTFCYNTFFNKEITRIKSAEKIEHELSYLVKEFGVKRVQYCDDTLCGGSRKRIMEMCEVTAKLGLSWEASAPVNVINEQIVESMVKGNCECIFFGLESGDPEILKKFGKGATIERNFKAVEILSRSSLDVTYSLITGHPWENDSILKAQLDYADKLHSLHPQAGVAIQPYLPLPGTKMYETALQQGFQPPQDLEGWSRYTHDEKVQVPWLTSQRSRELRAIYLLAYFAFRYKRQLSGSVMSWVYFLFHKISLWRWKKRFFSFYVEGMIFNFYKELGRFYYSTKAFFFTYGQRLKEWLHVAFTHKNPDNTLAK